MPMSRRASSATTGHSDEPPAPVRRMSAFSTFARIKGKPTIDIILNDQQTGFVPSYTTLDKIEGRVSFNCPVDTQFDDIHIIFQGAAKTYVEKVATSAPTNPRTQAYHNFLRLSQPVSEADLPADRIAKAGVTYELPFMFVVPPTLLPQACSHAKSNPSITDAHLQLPPSLGDEMVSGDGKSLLDDLAPQMAQIKYGIRVLVTKKQRRNSTASSSVGGTRPHVLADAMKKLRIVPAADEQPPLRVSGECGEDDYILSKTKSLRKGIFKGKLGFVTVSAPQPAPIHLPYHRAENPCRPTTLATIKLRFDPNDASSQPPRMGNLWAKLKVATFFSTMPLRDYPSKSTSYIYDSQRGIYVESLPLACRNIESVTWTKQDPQSRRDSAISIPNASGAVRDGLPFYTAEVLVPIELPPGKTYVNTFHSCLVSRVYAIDVGISVHSGSSSKASRPLPLTSTQHLHLKLPLQVAADGNPNAAPVISAEEAASIARRESEFSEFSPRSVAPPPEAFAPDARGARGSIFVNPRWGSVSGPAGAPDASQQQLQHELTASPRASPPRSPTSPSAPLANVSEEAEPESEFPPEYSTFGSMARQRNGSVVRV